MRCFILLVMLALLVVPSMAQQEQPITIRDEDGRDVVIPATPEKIVCLSPAAAEVLCALGMSDKIAAVTEDCIIPSLCRCLQEKERVGTSGRNADLERILELKPDLVIAKTGSLFPEESEKVLVSCGIPVLRYRALHIDALIPMINDLGRIVNAEDKSHEIIGWITKYYNTILERVSLVPESERPTVYFMSMGHFDWTAGNQSAGDIRISEAGGRNIAGNLTETVPHVDMEWVIQQNPQIIIFSMASNQYKGDTPTEDEMRAKRDEIMSLTGFDSIDAVKSGRVYVMDINMASGLSELITLLYYAKWFHPDLFQDINPREVHAELLKKYFGMEIDGIHQVYPE
ncbi:MAG: ABC transporter substrate-binding protein [Methanothrix sp.]|nr:ABC transporter substrate-binding protein [Methanothrix sp.]MBC7079761.1 ABC transporter substrate-binding protein [Methanothrix sp.]NPU87837.1 ABC transporter substrate-binding protein [Methanothrix sp.]